MTDGSLIYLPGIAGHPAPSGALAAVEQDGWTVVVPELPGFDGRAGFRSPDDYSISLTPAQLEELHGSSIGGRRTGAQGPKTPRVPGVVSRR